ncbi:MAG: rhomboid family intramembrane serine protease [Cyanobacteria bacterium P01_A01_bin.123]
MADALLLQVAEQILPRAKFLLGFVGLLWLLELVDSLLLRGALNRYGIRPRRLIGLRGIVFAPLLHGDLGHLSANTLPLLVLGGLILLSGGQTWALVTVLVWLIGGLGVWLIGQPRSNHIGASGIVFGYLGFLLMRGYVDRSPGAIALAVLAGLLYGSTLWGLLPLRRGRSWQGHLLGFVVGGLTARELPLLQQTLEVVLQRWADL